MAVLTAARRREMDRIARDDRTTLANRVQTVEAENVSLRDQVSTQAAQIAMLTEMVTNAAAVSKLAEMLNGQHSVVVDRLDRMIAALPKRGGDDARSR